MSVTNAISGIIVGSGIAANCSRWLDLASWALLRCLLPVSIFSWFHRDSAHAENVS
ncbi:hypothetical protein ACNKHS_09560 [Shigella flexneri]